MQTALFSDFSMLPTGVQEGVIAILETCQQNNMSVRCEMQGRDFTVVIGRGYSSPKYWLDMYRPVVESRRKA